MIDGNSPSVLVRVCLLGAFQVQRRTENGTWETLDKTKWEKSYARPLFKRLLCASSRRAQRGTLIDDLWPDPEHPELVERYLNDASYHLRKVLGTPGLLQTFGHASGYQLADQSRIWTDVDECTALMTEVEHIGRTSAPAVRLLEQAQAHFARGEVLEGEAGLWCHAKRGVFERLRYRCQLWLAEAYEQQGLAGQAEMQYSQLLEDNPLDEDVLCRLMSLLHRQGMTQQARRCFEETNKRFKQDGLRLSPATDAFAQRLFNEPRQVEFTVSILDTKSNESLNSPEAAQRTDAVGLSLFTTAQTSLKALVGEHLSERVTFLDTDRETLDFFEKLTEICWHLSKGHDLDTAGRILSAYLPKMVSLALPPSQQQHAVARIVSPGYLLAASLAGHHNDLKARQYYSEQALLFAGLAQDRNLQVAALTQLALTFDYQKHPHRAIQTYQQIIPHLNEVSPHLGTRMYVGLSDAYAQSGLKQEALSCLSIAYENFPEKPEGDPNFLYADCEHFTLLLWAGLTRLDLAQFDEAAKSFALVDGLQPKIKVSEKVRIAFLIYQAATFIALRNMEQACDYLEAAIKASLVLGSERRYRESLEVFAQMQSQWGREKRVTSLGELFMV